MICALSIVLALLFSIYGFYFEYDFALFAAAILVFTASFSNGLDRYLDLLEETNEDKE